MGMLVNRFECGCVGLVPDHEGRTWILKPCDQPIGAVANYVVHQRDMTNKRWEPLDDAEEAIVMNDLGILCSYGERFIELRSLMGNPVPNPGL